MQFVGFLILLSCIFTEYSLAINDNNYIFCTPNCSEIVVSLSTPFTFPSQCQTNNNHSDFYVRGLFCAIQYRINYQYQKITILFEVSNDTSILDSRKSNEFFLQEIRLHLTSYASQSDETYRKYVCNIKDDCARDFYLNTIENLINDGQYKLRLIKGKLYNDSLIIGQGSRRRCLVTSEMKNSTAERCGYGLCYVHYENYLLDNKRQNKTQNCDLESTPSLYSYVTYDGVKSKEILEYICNKHVCNRDKMILKIQNIINQYTKWNSNITERHLKKTNLSIKQTISSSMIVLMIILIQNVCFCF